MNILVASSIAEYSNTEEKEITEVLISEFERQGHNADYFYLPFNPDPLIVLDQILCYRLLDVSAADLLVTIGYPAFVLPHQNKAAYLFDTMPMLHEYWDTEYGVLGNNQYSEILITLDEIERKYLSDAVCVFCGSDLLNRDLLKRYGFKSDVLYLPHIKKEAKNSAGNTFVTETRLAQNSRYIELLQHIAGIDGVAIDIYVPGAHPMYLNSLKRLITTMGLNGRVRVIERPLANTDLSAAKGYIHFDYKPRRISLSVYRCMEYGIPVVSLNDGGAVNELLKDYQNAYVTEIDRLENCLAAVLREAKTTKPVYGYDIGEFAKRLVERCV